MIDYSDTVFASQVLRKKEWQVNEAPKAARSERIRHSAPAEVKTNLVLVIDDSPAMVEVLSDVLYFLNCEVLAALNGDEGLSLFADFQDSISLIILDMNMPVMSGEETLRRLRILDPDVRVVISSSLSEEEAKRRCSVQGQAVPYFLQKPYALDQAANLLQSVLES